jgi:hypothetical protein
MLAPDAAGTLACMRPAMYLLLGFPGAGKYTVAEALVAELESRGDTDDLDDITTLAPADAALAIADHAAGLRGCANAAPVTSPQAVTGAWVGHHREAARPSGLPAVRLGEALDPGAAR